MPQLNPEFYISQLFWLVITFAFLFIFLWRISLPRIGSAMEKRANKIHDDIKVAKKHQAEAEEIQKKIDNQLKQAKSEASDLIKNANLDFQERSNKELEKIDKKLDQKLSEAAKSIEKNKSSSLEDINNQIFDITKLTLSKVSKIKINENEIKQIITKSQKGFIN